MEMAMEQQLQQQALRERRIQDNNLYYINQMHLHQAMVQRYGNWDVRVVGQPLLTHGTRLEAMMQLVDEIAFFSFYSGHVGIPSSGRLNVDHAATINARHWAVSARNARIQMLRTWCGPSFQGTADGLIGLCAHTSDQDRMDYLYGVPYKTTQNEWTFTVYMLVGLILYTEQT